MSDVEQRLRVGLAEAGLGAAPPDPVGWVRARVARDRRRRAATGAVAGLAVAGVAGVAALVVPSLSLEASGGDRLTEQVGTRPPDASPSPTPAASSLASPITTGGPALVVHNKASGQAAAAADAAVRACLDRSGVTRRTVDGAEPAAYVVTSGGQEGPLAQAQTCLSAVPGVLVERSTEDLAGRGPVPVATMPGGAPLYEDGDQQALAEQLRGRLRVLVEAALPGDVEDGPVNYATTRTPTGPSRNLLGSVDWSDDRGHVSILVTRAERSLDPRPDDCFTSPPPSALDCARVTLDSSETAVTLLTGTQGDRNAVLVLADGSTVTVTQMPRTHAAKPGGDFYEVTPRPDLPLSDRELATIADSLSR